MPYDWRQLLNGETLFGSAPASGVMGDETEVANRDGIMALASQLLAGSGYSNQRSTFGQQAGLGLQAASAARVQSLQNQQKQRLIDAQIQALGAKQQPPSLVGNVDPSKYTPESLAQLERTRDYSVLVPRTPQATPLDPLAKLTADYEGGLITAGDFAARRKSILEGRPPITVNLEHRAEGKAEEAYGSAIGNAFAEVLSEGRMAQDERDILVSLRDNPADTGPTQNFRAAAGSLFADLGLPVSESRLNQITDFGAYKAAANDLVLAKQMRQKGPQTDKDAAVIRDTVANSKNLPEVNRMIVGYGLALADRKVERAQFAEEYRQREGKIEGWESEWREYMRRTPLVGKNPTSGRVVFWNEYIDQMRAANPDATDEEILDQWRSSYAAR